MTSPSIANDGTWALTRGLQWILGVLTGDLATAIAVIAVAGIGLGMLSGRVTVRRGAGVILGCFLLFGASTIARGLWTAGAAAAPPFDAVQASPLPQASALPEPPAPVTSSDPYAGAALRR